MLQHEERLKLALEKKRQDRYEKLQSQLESLADEEKYAKSVQTTGHNLHQQLERIIRDNPDLNKKSENNRNEIHFHAFRYFFKTQVTDAHESDFAEALMGHKSVKLVYYRQNAKRRQKTYLEVEHALTISETEQIEKNYTELQQDNQDLRGELNSLIGKFRELEKRIEVSIPHS